VVGCCVFSFVLFVLYSCHGWFLLVGWLLSFDFLSLLSSLTLSMFVSTLFLCRYSLPSSLCVVIAAAVLVCCWLSCCCGCVSSFCTTTVVVIVDCCCLFLLVLAGSLPYLTISLFCCTLLQTIVAIRFSLFRLVVVWFLFCMFCPCHPHCQGWHCLPCGHSLTPKVFCSLLRLLVTVCTRLAVRLIVVIT
jgi:hypothetical protein